MTLFAQIFRGNWEKVCFTFFQQNYVIQELFKATKEYFAQNTAKATSFKMVSNV